MATNNMQLFDANKGNMMSTQEYLTNQQRLNGVQQGIASSMLQNKVLYQVSLVAYAIGQAMVNNGLNASDDDAVSTFVGNLANTFVQKIVDKASTTEAQAGTDANKFMTPATTRAAINVLKATSGMATAGTDDTHWMTPALVKQMVGENVPSLVGYAKVFDQSFSGNGTHIDNINIASILNSYNDFLFIMEYTISPDVQYGSVGVSSALLYNNSPLLVMCSANFFGSSQKTYTSIFHLLKINNVNYVYVSRSTNSDLETFELVPLSDFLAINQVRSSTGGTWAIPNTSRFRILAKNTIMNA